MPHFGIESLGHGLGGFLTGTTTDTGQSILGGAGVESGLSTRNIINRIEAIIDRNLVGSPQFQFEQVQVPLFELGQASLDISGALSEQVAIREEQLARTQEAIRNQQIFTDEVNQRLSQQVTELGQSLGDIGQGGFDPLKFFTDNPLLGGIGIGGLAVGAVVLFLLIKK